MSNQSFTRQKKGGLDQHPVSITQMLPFEKTCDNSSKQHSKKKRKDTMKLVEDQDMNTDGALPDYVSDGFCEIQ